MTPPPTLAEIIEKTKEQTLYAISVEQILALLVRGESTFGTAQTLACETPQQTLALDTERRRRGR